MSNLTRAHDELFHRAPDERFGTLQHLWQHCHEQHQASQERWHPPEALQVAPHDGRLQLRLNGDGDFRLNDWSFSQLCQLARVSKDTVNKVTPDTASAVFGDTLGRLNSGGGKPLQAFTGNDTVRSIHGASYTRLANVELLSMLREFATDFEPPQAAGTTEDGEPEARGLYCGEQDMFVFLIDPLGWTEIEGEAFAPGFFLWNSEVGKRSVGLQTFWFQAVCQNHIVWDAVEVVDFKRKHTANVHDSLREIRNRIEQLVQKRDQRKEGFAATIQKAMNAKLGDDADEVMKVLAKHGITRAIGQDALKIAQEQGKFTVFAVVDAITKLAGRYTNAGDRTEVDQKASRLLALAK